MDFGLDFLTEQRILVDSEQHLERRTQAAFNIVELDPKRAEQVFINFLRFGIANPNLDCAASIELVCIVQLGEVSSRQMALPVLNELKAANPTDPFVLGYIDSALINMSRRRLLDVLHIKPRPSVPSKGSTCFLPEFRSS